MLISAVQNNINLGWELRLCYWARCVIASEIMYIQIVVQVVT